MKKISKLHNSDKKLQKNNEAATLRRQEQKTHALVAKAEAGERTTRGERGDGRPKRQTSRIDYQVLANTGQNNKGATVGREMR